MPSPAFVPVKRALVSAGARPGPDLLKHACENTRVWGLSLDLGKAHHCAGGDLSVSLS